MAFMSYGTTCMNLRPFGLINTEEVKYLIEQL